MPGLLRSVANCDSRKASGRKKAVLFFEKKNQKNFCPSRVSAPRHPRRHPTNPGGEKFFLLLFFQKRKTLAFLPLAFLFQLLNLP
jgi:hypothetical protein